VTVKVGRDNAVEVGDLYLQFFGRLLNWLIGNPAVS
jgi:hypothetical protein